MNHCDIALPIPTVSAFNELTVYSRISLTSASARHYCGREIHIVSWHGRCWWLCGKETTAKVMIFKRHVMQDLPPPRG